MQKITISKWYHNRNLYILAAIGMLAATLMHALSVSAINPVITEVSPAMGVVEGGQTITLKGDNLTAKQVKINQVSAGCDHTIALGDDGRVYAWGTNSNGVLGIGTTTGISAQPVEVDRTGALAGKTITQVSAGCYHSAALDSDGHVYTWGRNDAGQLGNGNTGTSSGSPVDITNNGALAGKRIVQIASGGNHMLALDESGAVYSWGQNGSGRLGDGTGTNRNLPVAVDMSGVLAGVSIKSVYGLSETSVALSEDGQLYGWGSNWFGELGYPGQAVSTSPVSLNAPGVFTGKTIVQVATNNYNLAVLDSDGAMYTWGANASGQVGNGTSGGGVRTPYNVNASGIMAGKTIVDISVGLSVSYALDSDGVLYSWGSDLTGRLGNGGADTNELSPQLVDMTGVLAGKHIVSVDAGRYSHAHATDDQGRVYSWGQGISGRIGDGSQSTRTTPVAVNVANPSALAVHTPHVYFGENEATNVTMVDGSTITAEVPAHAAGPVDVRIELGNDDAAYRTTVANGYTYVATAPAPANVSAEVTVEGVNLSWDAPQAAAGVEVTGYTVEYSSDGGATWTTFTTTDADTLSTLIPREIMQEGTEYTFRVTAQTSYGQSDPGELTVLVSYEEADTATGNEGSENDGTPSAPNTGFGRLQNMNLLWAGVALGLGAIAAAAGVRTFRKR